MTLGADSRVTPTLHLLPTQGNCGDSTMSRFQIYSVPFKGGTIGIAPMPDFSDQLTRVAVENFAPALVVSMTESREFPNGISERFGAEITGLGAQWFHMPIKDFGAPTEQEGKVWPAILDACKTAIMERGCVLFHCKGGQGRSGMAAVRLMVEMGADPHRALNSLRAQKPGAIETDAQFTWASKGKW